MDIKKTADGSKLTIALNGRLDTTTAPQLEATLKESLADVTALVLDFAELVYISSAGLRVVLFAQKHMNAAGGTLAVRNVNSTIMDVFEVTGFSDILTIE